MNSTNVSVSPEGVENFLQILGMAVPAGFPASLPSTSQIDQMPTDQTEVEKNDEDVEDMELDLAVKFQFSNFQAAVD